MIDLHRVDTNLTLSYDLSKHEDAQEFRVALAASGIHRALGTHLSWLNSHVGADGVHDHEEPRIFKMDLRTRLNTQGVSWVLNPGVETAMNWRRPMRLVTRSLDAEAFAMASQAQGLFEVVRAYDAQLPAGDTINWPWMGAVNTLATLIESAQVIVGVPNRHTEATEP